MTIDPDEQAQTAACLANDCEDLDDVLAHLTGLRARIAASTAGPSRQREPRARAAWSFRAAAARLGVGRDRLRGLVAAGAIEVVPWGKDQRIPAAELERLLTEGLPRPEPSPAPVKRRRRSGAAPRDEREAAVQRILSVEET